MLFRHPIPLIWRTVILRALLGSTVIYLVSSIVTCFQLGWGYLPPMRETVPTFFVFPSFIVLHHVLRLWPRRYWLEVGEILCSLVETCGSAFVPYFWWRESIVTNPRIPGLLVMGVSCLVLGASVFAAFLILLWEAAINRGKNLLRQYDFSAGLCPLNYQWNFIFVITTVRKRFRTDNRFIRWLRGGLAILCLVALFFLMFYVFLGQPLWRGRYSVIRISKVPTVELFGAVPNSNTQVIMDVSELRRLTRNIPLSILNVTTTLSNILDSSEGPGIADQPKVVYPTLQVAHPLQCQNTTHWKEEGRILMTSCPLVMDPDDPKMILALSLPLVADLEILVTVDFSTIANVTQERFKIGLYPGLTDSAQTTLASTNPIYLSLGSHFYGSASISYMEQSLNRRFSTFGLPGYRSFPVLNIGHLFSDWASPVLNNRTASLRLLIPFAFEARIEREYFEGSVLSGFALIGGTWTFINGVFVSVFGTTLLLVLFEIKPLSVYGLVHFFHSTEGSLIPKRLSAEDREWIIEVLSEHLLDDNIRNSWKSGVDSDLVEPELELLRYDKISVETMDPVKSNSLGRP